MELFPPLGLPQETGSGMPQLFDAIVEATNEDLLTRAIEVKTESAATANVNESIQASGLTVAEVRQPAGIGPAHPGHPEYISPASLGLEEVWIGEGRDGRLERRPIVQAKSEE